MNLLNQNIDEAKKICIIGHMNPDGDCIGSCLTLYNYIKNKYGEDKKVKVYLEEFNEKYLALPNADKISNSTMDAEKYDLTIIVDCGNIDRIKLFKRYFDEAKIKMVIDHHENNTFNADYKIINEKSIATCEILYENLEKEFIDKNVAICLYLGIATDSGCFRYKACTKKTFEIAGNLIDYGFDFTYLLDTIVFDNTINQRKVQGFVFDRLKLICKNKVAYSYITFDEMQEFNVDKKDIDNIIVYLREITGIKVAIFAYPVGYKIYKISLRSKDENINVAEFCKMHEGGGHKLAAGCIYYGNIENVSIMIENDIGNFINGKE